LEFPHLFNFVEINDEALFEVMKVFDALATKNRGVLRAVEMLDTLVVLLA
jgi:hypothetical protein